MFLPPSRWSLYFDLIYDIWDSNIFFINWKYFKQLLSSVTLSCCSWICILDFLSANENILIQKVVFFAPVVDVYNSFWLPFEPLLLLFAVLAFIKAVHWIELHVNKLLVVIGSWSLFRQDYPSRECPEKTPATRNQYYWHVSQK